MPTLPLYTPNPGHPDASHAIIAPGGYERWYFDAETDSGDLRVVAVFSLGAADHPDHATYRRRFRRYLRAPTRRPPPTPADWSAVSLAVYQAAGTPLRIDRACAAGEFRASSDALDVSAGPDGVTIGQADSLGLKIATPGVELTFRPLRARLPQVLALFPRPHEPARHHWIVAAPICVVEGVVRVGGGRAVAFSGRGYHDHHFGTEPAGRWIRGRVIGEGRVTAFHLRRSDARSAGGAHVLEADAHGVRDAISVSRLEWTRFPTSVEFETTGIKLRRPRVLDRSGSIKRALYEVSATTSSGLDGRLALCEWV